MSPLRTLFLVQLVSIGNSWNGPYHHHHYYQAAACKTTPVPPLGATSECWDQYKEQHEEWLNEDDINATNWCNSMAAMLIVHRNNPTDKIPNGWRRATKEEAEARRDHLLESFAEWEMYQLVEDDWRIGVQGNDANRTQKMAGGSNVSGQIILQARRTSPVVEHMLRILGRFHWSSVLLWSVQLIFLRAVSIVYINNSVGWATLQQGLGSFCLQLQESVCRSKELNTVVGLILAVKVMFWPQQHKVQPPETSNPDDWSTNTSDVAKKLLGFLGNFLRFVQPLVGLLITKSVMDACLFNVGGWAVMMQQSFSSAGLCLAELVWHCIKILGVIGPLLASNLVF